jgi:hypothetical protein
VNDNETSVNTGITATAEKKAWITPSATVEQVSDVTKVTGGGSTDGCCCHS